MGNTSVTITAFEGNLQKLCLQWHPVFSIQKIEFSEITAKSMFNSNTPFC